MNEVKNDNEAKRQRSPDYPRYSLKECIGFLYKYIEKNGFNESRRDVAVRYMGHSPTSSTANRVLASVQHFGLFDTRGSGNNKFFSPSPLAKEIYKFKDQPSEQTKVLQKAALYGAPMQMVWEVWHQSIPPSRKALENSLFVEFAFTKKGAQQFARVVEETYEYARLQDRDSIEELEDMVPESQLEEEVEKTDQNGAKGGGKLEVTPSGYTDYLIPVGEDDSDRHAMFRAPTGLTQDDIDFIVEYIQLIGRKLVKRGKST